MRISRKDGVVMRIELTEEQYKALLELVTAGNYVFNRYEESENREAIHQEVEDLVFSAAQRAECYNYFNIDDDGKLIRSFHLADEVATKVSDYNHSLFERIIEKGNFAEKLPALNYVNTNDDEDWFEEYTAESLFG